MSAVEAPEPETGQADALVGTTLAGRYRIDALLGVGGMGAVYKATHVHMHKTVALKLLHPEMASVPEVLVRFEREAVAAASVTHPNLAAALDFGKLPDGAFYLVMEFIAGQLLREALSSSGMPAERVVGIGIQIAEALQAAHAAGVVHRDLKPENVMLRSGPELQVKVLDLGIAKVPIEATGGSALTQAGAVLGTPAYMSPEQAIGAKIDHRSDLYSLGVVLYEMVSGKPPFSDNDGPYAAIARHIAEPPPALPVEVPTPLASLILQLLEKIAAARPQSASEVIQRLQEIDAGLTAVAVPAIEPETPPASSVSQPTAARPLLWRRPPVLAAVALTLVGMGAWLADTVSGDAPAPSSSAVVPNSSVAASTAPLRATSAPKRTTSAAATAPTAARTSTASKPQQRKGGKKQERKTGPGGIYIPPPKDWF
jgi:serine/threonine protein kinase